jgi:hypothetical protein
MTWHVDAMTAAHYSVGATDAADAASVEAHLMACDECRTVINAYADDAVLAAVWADVNDSLDAVHLGWIERAMRVLGCSDVTSRIVAATTRARWAYVFVVAFNVLVAFASAQSVDPDAVFLVFLLLAPLGPLVAVAGAFGGWADPCHAVLRTLPTSTLRLTLVRTVAGVVPALVLTAAAVPWLADRGWLAVGWLLPALALAVVTLALSTWIDVERAAIVVGGVWVALPVALRLPVHDLLDAFAGPVQIVSAVAAAVGALVVVARQSKFEYREM